MTTANFGPITDDVPIFGACRPGHLGGDLGTWTDVLSDRGVSGVLCLLSESEASRWGLPAGYDGPFETAHVPIRDRHLPDVERLARAVDTLESMRAGGDRVAIHCNAGLGRTGVVAAAWLVRERGLAPAAALEGVESTPWPRSPREAIRDGNATESELFDLLGRL